MRKAIEVTKRRVLKDWYFVGLVDDGDLLKSFQILETVAPNLFLDTPAFLHEKTFWDVYQDSRPKNKTELREDEFNYLAKGVLRYEMDMYEFIKAIFDRKYKVLDVAEKSSASYEAYKKDPERIANVREGATVSQLVKKQEAEEEALKRQHFYKMKEIYRAEIAEQLRQAKTEETLLVAKLREVKAQELRDAEDKKREDRQRELEQREAAREIERLQREQEAVERQELLREKQLEAQKQREFEIELQNQKTAELRRQKQAEFEAARAERERQYEEERLKREQARAEEQRKIEEEKQRRQAERDKAYQEAKLKREEAERKQNELEEKRRAEKEEREAKIKALEEERIKRMEDERNRKKDLEQLVQERLAQAEEKEKRQLEIEKLKYEREHHIDIMAEERARRAKEMLENEMKRKALEEERRKGLETDRQNAIETKKQQEAAAAEIRRKAKQQEMWDKYQMEEKIRADKERKRQQAEEERLEREKRLQELQLERMERLKFWVAKQGFIYLNFWFILTKFSTRLEEERKATEGDALQKEKDRQMREQKQKM